MSSKTVNQQESSDVQPAHPLDGVRVLIRANVLKDDPLIDFDEFMGVMDSVEVANESAIARAEVR